MNEINSMLINMKPHDPDKVYTKGNLCIQDIEVGDILYEYEYGTCIKSRVIKKPYFNEKYGSWMWKCIHIMPDETEGKEINYSCNPDYTHYGPNVYGYESYSGMRRI